VKEAVNNVNQNIEHQAGPAKKNQRRVYGRSYIPSGIVCGLESGIFNISRPHAVEHEHQAEDQGKNQSLSQERGLFEAFAVIHTIL
jgi:hypothetical protein